MIMQDPNPEDPLNKEAAKLFQDNQRQFQTYVQVSAQGGDFCGSDILSIL